MRTIRVAIVPLIAIAGLLFLVSALSHPATAGAPRATDLFAATDGSGTACTQDVPCTLQTALAQAAGGDSIYVAAGTYTSTQNPLLDINKSVTIYGGWNGGPNNPGIVRWPEMLPAVLNGEGARRVVRINGPYSVTLDGLGIGGGLPVDTSGGAGVLIQGGAQVTIRHCGIGQNYVGMADGAGVRVEGASTVLIEQSAVVSNTAVTLFSQGGNGGGVFAAAGSYVTVVDSTVSHNSADAGGAGLRLSGATATLVNLTIADNTGGGADGIYATNTALTLTSSIVVSNTRGVRVDGTGATAVTYNDVWNNAGGNYAGLTDPTGTNGNVSLDPLFVSGPYLTYYLSQVAAGQAVNSPALDAGNGPATALADYDYLTTRSDNGFDTGTVDMGYHHRKLYWYHFALFTLMSPGTGEVGREH